MPEESVRLVPPLHFFVSAKGGPTAMHVGGKDMFLFFGTEAAAEAYREEMAMPAEWQLVSDNEAEQLIEMCKLVRAKWNCSDFVINPSSSPGSTLRPRSVENMIELIEYAAAREQEQPGSFQWDH
jgi:hypothetical protein